MLGFIFFLITLIFWLGMALFTASKPTLVGENAMGYGLGLAFFGLGFAISALALTLTLLIKGNFHWVASGTSGRSAVVLSTWLFITITTFFCAVFKWEWHSNTDLTYPYFLRIVATWHGQIWIPLLWLVGCLLSLNTDWQSSLSSTLIRAPFWGGLLLSGLYCGGLLVGYVRDSAASARADLEHRQQQRDRWHQQNLDYLASQTPSNPIMFLLGYANRFQDEDIRQAAIKKIRAHSDWEAKILALLEHEHTAREVYYFLDGNAVTQKEAFARALNKSLLPLASTIAADIRDSNNLQNWSFDMYGIEQVLRAIDYQFQGTGVDFYPNVYRLRQALETTPPERFKGVRFTIAQVIDGWLQTHKQQTR
ncbi:hypothetical protein DYU11_13920 [Fibrisoma montanum]|uniref:Uncharacterized protein n=1 Tax=Fibrisoma montanum TaxID=2305895 RepID=A0A418MCK9_9BACT|nr:hypothetical protein [Fibrisoma montanum]RIV24056.1 hypothetical protein DYU11_13920 [Fibrisoma montanum]